MTGANLVQGGQVALCETCSVSKDCLRKPTRAACRSLEQQGNGIHISLMRRDLIAAMWWRWVFDVLFFGGLISGIGYLILVAITEGQI
jgi:hypothetical protein